MIQLSKPSLYNPETNIQICQISNETLFNYGMPLAAFWKSGLELRWHETQFVPGPPDREQQLHPHIAADTPWQLFSYLLSHPNISKALQM